MNLFLRLRLSGFALVALCAITRPGVGEAQVYKCVDRAGRTTYQQQPCPDAQKGGPLGVMPDNGSTRDADAPEAPGAPAAPKVVVPGMPRAKVMEVFGPPQEMRPGRSGENAAEIWEYRRPDLTARVAFRSGVVVWVNDNPGEAPPVVADTDSPRQNIAIGSPCSRLEFDLGPPEATNDEFDSALGKNVQRFSWGPESTYAKRTVVTCDDGKVARVDQQPAQ